MSPPRTYVYFLRQANGEGAVKIGRSDRPHERLREANKWSPVPLEIVATLRGAPELEARLHAHLRAHHSHAEWFLPTPEVLAVLAEVSAGTFDVAALPVHGRLASVSAGNNREGGIAAAFSRRLAELKAGGLPIPREVEDAARTYGCSPQEKARRRAIVRAFVEANRPDRTSAAKAA